MSIDYIPSNDAEFLQKLITFDTNIGTYAAAFRLTAEQLEDFTADKNDFAYVTAGVETVRNASTEWTEWRNIMRHGDGSGATRAAVPVFPSPPFAVAPGIEVRFRALINQIKASPGYNEAIGKALGIVRETQAPPDLTTVKPVLTLKLSGDDVRILWSWGGNRGPLQMCEIHVDRNDSKGFVPLAYDTNPNYTDTHEQPIAPTKWSYKATFRANERRVGQWSDIITITVGG